MITKIGIGLLVVFIAIQFIPANRDMPRVGPDADFLSISTMDTQLKTLVETACYDCHSYQTRYPWYTKVAPVSWWIQGHINGGREHLNFSTWHSLPAGKKSHKLEECAEEIISGHMPPKSYRFMHKETAWSETEKEKLVAWFENESKK